MRTRIKDKRSVARFPVSTEKEQAVLRWQDRDYSARLVDHSAVGFGIQIDESIEIKAGDTPDLIWDDEYCRVRIVSRTDDANFVRLGVVRLEELDSADEIDVSPGLFGINRARESMPQSNFGPYVAGLVVLLGVLFVAAAWESLPSRVTSEIKTAANKKEKADAANGGAVVLREQRGSSQSLIAAVADRVFRSSDAKILPKPIRQWLLVRKQAIQDTVLGAVDTVLKLPIDGQNATVESVAAAAVDGVRRAVEAGDEALVLAVTQFMGLLELSPQQRRDLDGVLKSMRQATQDLQRRSRELGTAETMREIEQVRRSAGEQLTTILTAEQVAQLRKLSAGASASSRTRAQAAGVTTSDQPAAETP